MSLEQDQRYQRFMDQGHSAAWEQDWDRAAKFYLQALELNPEDVKAINSLALAMYEMQEFDDALKLYLQAAKIAPDDPIPLEKSATLYENAGNINAAAEMAVRAAELYLKRKEVERAIENWSRAVSISPEHLRAHSRLAIVFERMGHKQQAAREYLQIASLMQHSGDISKAVDAVNRALKVDPDNSEGAQALVMLRDGELLPKPARPRGGTGPIQSSKKDFQLPAPDEDQTEGLNPIDQAKKTALEILAELFFDQPPEETDDVSTQRDFQSIVSGTGPLFAKQIDRSKIMLHLSQAVDSQLSGDHFQAAEELSRAIDAGLDNMAAYFQLGALRYESNRLESAIRYLQRAVQHPDFSLGSRLLLGESYLQMDRPQNAAIEFLEALKLADIAAVKPEQADGLRQLYDPLIEAQAQDGDETQQKSLSETISKMLIREDWLVHIQQYRNQSFSEYDDGHIIPLAEVISETHSSDVVAAISNVRQLAHNGQPHAAIEEAFFALEHAPSYLPLHITIGDLLLAQDLTKEAIDKFLVVARSYSVRGETGRSIEMLRRVVDLAPMNLDARNRLIDQLTNRGTCDEAVDEYIKLAEVYYSLADLTNSRKAYAKALRLTQISDLDSNWQVRVLHRIADIDIQSLNWRQAAQIFQELVKVKPDDQKAYSMLIDLNFRLGESKQAIKELDDFIQYMNTTNQLPETLEFLKKQVEEHPDQASIRRRYGEVNYLVGNVDEAVHQLDLTQDLLVRTGDRHGAMAAVQRIVELNPPNVEKYQDLLARLQSD